MNRPPKIVGIGGVFIYSNNAEALAGWYQKFLGIPYTPAPQYGAYYLDYRYVDPTTNNPISINWSIIQANRPIPKYDQANFCINYRVNNMEEFVAFLNANDLKTSETETYPEGLFTYLNDPDGNRVELWEPSATYYTV